MTDEQQAMTIIELKTGESLFHDGLYSEAFRFFERAHILGQRSVYYHTVAHYWMLRIGLKQKNFTEVLGQLFRIPAGIIGSAVGIVPTGNTGGTNVNPFKKMPIPEDLKRFMN